MIACSELRPYQFVSFVGIDGAGKSTAAELVAARLLDQGIDCCHLDKKGFEGSTWADNRQLGLHGQALWSGKQGRLGVSWGDDYWFHLQVAWFSLLDSVAVGPALEAGRMVVIDDWYFKLLARFLVKGGRWRSKSAAAFDHLTEPDLTIVLDVDPETAANRMPEFGVSESGGSDGGAEVGRASFIRYQSEVRSVILDLASTRSMPIIDVSDKLPGDVVDEVYGLILNRPNSLDIHRPGSREMFL